MQGMPWIILATEHSDNRMVPLLSWRRGQEMVLRRHTAEKDAEFPGCILTTLPKAVQEPTDHGGALGDSYGHIDGSLLLKKVLQMTSVSLYLDLEGR